MINSQYMTKRKSDNFIVLYSSLFNYLIKAKDTSDESRRDSWKFSNNRDVLKWTIFTVLIDAFPDEPLG